MVVLIYIIVKMIDKSKLGYGLKTVREDEDTANAIGINPWKYKVIATFISCGLMAVCGVFYANYYRFIDPEIMIQTQSVEYLMPGSNRRNRQCDRATSRGSYYYTSFAVFECDFKQHCGRLKPGNLCSDTDCRNFVSSRVELWDGLTGVKLKAKIDRVFDSIDGKLFSRK